MRHPTVPPWAASLRVRLTLWNVGALALMLLGLGLALRGVLQMTQISQLDGFMRSEAAALAPAGRLRPPPPPGSPPPPFLRRIPLVLLDARGRPLRAFSAPAPYDPQAFRRALAGETRLSTGRAGREPARLLSFPLRGADGAVTGAGQVARSLLPVYQVVHAVTGALLTLALPGLLIAGLGGAFLTTRALRPVRAITHAAGRIEATDLSRRLAVTGHDELAELAGTFNAMLARLEESFAEKQRAYARMEAAYEQQRRFTADASHELKSPLTVIQGTTSLALSGAPSEARLRQSLETVGRASASMTRIVQDLLLLARSDAGELTLDRRPVAVGDLLRLAAESQAGQPAGEAAPVRLCPADPALVVSGDPGPLTRLFVNLLDNAARHTPAEGRITVEAVREAAPGGDWVTVTVRDTGAGIAPEHLPHVFERFYRVDTARARRHGGSGLGLSIARSIAEAHGGALTLDSAPGVGTCATVRLPLLPA